MIELIERFIKFFYDRQIWNINIFFHYYFGQWKVILITWWFPLVQRWETTFKLAHSRRNHGTIPFTIIVSAERWAALKIISSVLSDRCNSWITIREIRLWFPGTTMLREFLWETHGTPGISMLRNELDFQRGSTFVTRRIDPFAWPFVCLMIRIDVISTNLCTLLRDRLSADWELRDIYCSLQINFPPINGWLKK